MKPFEDEVTVQTIDDLSIENGEDKIVLHGFIEFTKDDVSLASIRSLIRTLESIETRIESSLNEATKNDGSPDIHIVSNPLFRRDSQ